MCVCLFLFPPKKYTYFYYTSTCFESEINLKKKFQMKKDKNSTKFLGKKNEHIFLNCVERRK